MYITIDNVPTGVMFYTKPGSGQCRYSEQGTPDTYASLRVVLYSFMFQFECPAPHNRFPSLNSLPRISVPSFAYRYYSKLSILSRTYSSTEQGIRYCQQYSVYMASVNFPLFQLVCIELILNTELSHKSPHLP